MINTDYIQQYNEETKDVFTIENFKKYGEILLKGKNLTQEEINFLLNFSNKINQFNNEINRKSTKNTIRTKSSREKYFENDKYFELNNAIAWMKKFLQNKNNDKKQSESSYSLYSSYVQNVNLSNEEIQEYYDKEKFFSFIDDYEFKEIIENGYKYVLNSIFKNLEGYKSFVEWWSEHITENIIKNIYIPEEQTGIPQIDTILNIGKAIVAAGIIFDLILKYFLQDFENIKKELKLFEEEFGKNEKEKLLKELEKENYVYFKFLNKIKGRKLFLSAISKQPDKKILKFFKIDEIKKYFKNEEQFLKEYNKRLEDDFFENHAELIRKDYF